MIKFLLALVVVFAGGGFCVYHFQPEFPIDRHLACHDGNSFDGRIVGKMDGALLVEVRTDSGTNTIELPIASLRLLDRIHAHWPPETSPPYPVARTITSKDGRSLDAHVLGRTHEGVTIERSSDRERFHIPLENLVEDDRRFVSKLPDQAGPRILPPPPPPPPPPIESNYVAIRRKEIAELEKKAELYRKELASRTLNRILSVKRQEDLDKVMHEIRSLRIAIDSHKYLTKEE